MTDTLEKQLISELTTEVDSSVTHFVQHLVDQLPGAPLAVLFYGSLLRKNNPDGILDFYIIIENSFDYPGTFLGKMANSFLPPNVCYEEYHSGIETMRAKVAFLSYRQLLKRCHLNSLDTTMWARFCQPVRLVWVRNAGAADQILEALRRAVITAACWAALLGPESALAEDYWHNLFTHTYRAELRVERKGRSRNLLQDQKAYYTQCLVAAWKQAGLTALVSGGKIHPVLTESACEKARKRWCRIEYFGKILNVLRLLKAAFTFRGGVGYLLWKIRRHTGKDIKVTVFEHQHPILGLPLFLWRLRKLRS